MAKSWIGPPLKPSYPRRRTNKPTSRPYRIAIRKHHDYMGSITPRWWSAMVERIRTTQQDFTFLSRVASHVAVLLLVMVIGWGQQVDFSSYLESKVNLVKGPASNIWQGNEAEDLSLLNWNALPQTIVEERPAAARTNPISYQVRPGDTSEIIAERFNLNSQTITWSNPMVEENYNELRTGQTLIIPPVDGVMHTIMPGDSITALAAKYQVSSQMIVGYANNHLTSDSVPLVVGQHIMIPNGIKSVKPAEPIAVEPVPAYPTPVPIPTAIPQPKVVVAVASNNNTNTNNNSNNNNATTNNNSNNNNTNSFNNNATTNNNNNNNNATTNNNNNNNTNNNNNATTNNNTNNNNTNNNNNATTNNNTNNNNTNNNNTNNNNATTNNNSNNNNTNNTNNTNNNTQTTTNASATNDNNLYRGSTGCCIWPTRGRITQGVSTWHTALDLATYTGAPVYAADGGRVIAAGWDNTGYGYRVMIYHSAGISTLYGHLSRYLVNYGEYVNKGALIGRVGSTGYSTGPHLHFEVRRYNYRQSPWNYLP